MVGFLLLSLLADVTTSDLTGTVEVTRPLTRRRIAVDAYQNRAPALDGGAALNPSNEMDSVAIYVERINGMPVGLPASTVSQEPLELRQKNRNFSRQLVIVPVGATVSFPNDDPIFHNVFSLSKAKAFDLGYFPKNQTRVVKFTKPGIVEVFCHLHANMSATVVVAPTQYYTQPAKDGSFVLRDLPAGAEVDLVAWHRAAGFFRRRVKVPAGNVRFVLPLRETAPEPVDAPPRTTP
ncbi:hypothetical protein F183_A11100 [Bryobacterales bacterium F-183]|nr:hypothetical protein F183_A11100 [Bryobacterales bacterium F-183]